MPQAALIGGSDRVDKNAQCFSLRRGTRPAAQVAHHRSRATKRSGDSQTMQLSDIFRTAHANDASDIHLISGHPPMMRCHTVITPMDFPILTADTMTKILESMRFPNWPVTVSTPT